MKDLPDHVTIPKLPPSMKSVRISSRRVFMTGAMQQPIASSVPPSIAGDAGWRQGELASTFRNFNSRRFVPNAANKTTSTGGVKVSIWPSGQDL
ncbi:MAG TPA: hypothetical protein VMV69_13740 [Pirellulales bacterium]|nr:hypothetical protein [Pirellulales bacterium]